MKKKLPSQLVILVPKEEKPSVIGPHHFVEALIWGTLLASIYSFSRGWMTWVDFANNVLK